MNSDTKLHHDHATMKRRDFLQYSAMGSTLALARATGFDMEPRARSSLTSMSPLGPELEEATIAELQAGMQSGTYTAQSIAEMYLARIRAIDEDGPAVNAVIEINPDALAIANQLDEERRTTGVRGPLHGIPVMLKDNIDTGDRMLTTAGSLALVGSTSTRDAFLAQKLRQAGVVILGKTNLSEWANFRSTRSSSGWSARGGQTRNPYALDRSPCGSSSGSAVAVAANLCAAAIGTETDGSVVCPSSANSIVGIKPTLGLVSRSGIVPIAHSQDTAGPMGRTVADAAAVLGALTGVDPRDRATRESRGRASPDYTQFLDPTGLQGARIGVARNFFGFHERVDALMEDAVNEMRRHGATIIDTVGIPTGDQLWEFEAEVLYYEFKADLNAYLAERGTNIAARSLQELIEFNNQNRDTEMPYFGQELFITAAAKGPLSTPEYITALETAQRMARDEGIDAVMQTHRLDAIVAPTGSPSWLIDLVVGDHFLGGFSSAAAVAGYPHITVPVGYVFGLPVGISFFAGAYSEPTLIKLAYAFEQATKVRQPPQFLATADLG